MSVENPLPKLIKCIDALRHSPRPKFLFIAALLIALLLLTVSLWDVFQNENNRTYSGSFLLVETGEVLYAMNLPQSNRSEYGDEFHKFYIRLDKDSFSISRDAYYLQLGLDERLLDRSLDLSQTKTEDGYHYFAYLAKQPHGPDIPETELQCIVWEDTQSYSNNGTMLIRNLTVTDVEGVQHIYADIEVQFRNCHVEDWGIEGGDITLKGTFFQ